MATAQQALAMVGALYQALSSRREDIDRAYSYFRGDQKLAYATEEWRKFHADRYKHFSDNWCGVVGRSPVDRLRVDDFRLSDPLDQRTDDERELWTDWLRNDMGAQSKQGFLASTIAKRSAVLVWGDADGDPVATWEHPAQVIVDYDPEDRRQRRAALKAWSDGEYEMATLYLPNEVWKFQRKSATVVADGKTSSGLLVSRRVVTQPTDWDQREVPGERWPLPNPLGEVPVVEFPNRPMLDGEPISDIQGTIAMQDAINLLWAYMFTAADHASMAARVVLGAEPPKIPILDENGQIIGSKPAKIEDLAEGRLLFLPGVDSSARIDQWEAAKLDVFTAAIDKAVSHIAAQTSTPGHYLLSNEKFANLNGDALTAAETPLAMKVKSAQQFYDQGVKGVFRLFAKVRGNDALADRARLGTVQWKDAEMHSLSSIADAANKDRATGLSLRTVLERRYGFSEREVEREMERLREEASDPLIERFARDLGGVGDDTAGVG